LKPGDSQFDDRSQIALILHGLPERSTVRRAIPFGHALPYESGESASQRSRQDGWLPSLVIARAASRVPSWFYASEVFPEATGNHEFPIERVPEGAIQDTDVRRVRYTRRTGIRQTRVALYPQG